MNIKNAVETLNKFKGVSLTESLSFLEKEIIGADAKSAFECCSKKNINDEFIKSSLAVKEVAGEINVIIHASGILHSLKSILIKNEIVQSVSLGAGNTGKKFDLETNFQIAEFKFIDWRGGPEPTRQDGIFKDFYGLAEFKTTKTKNLYVVGTHYPLSFFKGGRSLKSVLAKQPAILENIINKYGSQISLVKDYFEIHKETVNIIDVSPHIGR